MSDIPRLTQKLTPIPLHLFPFISLCEKRLEQSQIARKPTFVLGFWQFRDEHRRRGFRLPVGSIATRKILTSPRVLRDGLKSLGSPTRVRCGERGHTDVRRLVRSCHQRQPAAVAVFNDGDARGVEVVFRAIFRRFDPVENSSHIFEPMCERERSSRTPSAAIVKVDGLKSRAALPVPSALPEVPAKPAKVPKEYGS